MEQAPTSHPKSNWKLAAGAGAIAGAAFLIVQFLLGSATQPSASGSAFIHSAAGILMGQDTATPPHDGGAVVWLSALVVHFVLSVGYGLVLVRLIRRMRLGPALGAGLIFGLLLYLINFFGFTYFFPWFAEARSWVSFCNHLLFGMVIARIYNGPDHPGRT